jgi:hypothetical protein
MAGRKVFERQRLSNQGQLATFENATLLTWASLPVPHQEQSSTGYVGEVDTGHVQTPTSGD